MVKDITSSAGNKRRVKRCVRRGNGRLIFTIGYERREGCELLDQLRAAGVDVVIDVRERPMSRKPAFRKTALERACSASGLAYESWPQLGSTVHQREVLEKTADFAAFGRRLRGYMNRYRRRVLDDLATIVNGRTVALLCFERDHEHCHRSVVAELLADRTGATVLALS